MHEIIIDVISAETRDSNSILDCHHKLVKIIAWPETSTLLLGLFSSSYNLVFTSLWGLQRMLHPLHDPVLCMAAPPISDFPFPFPFPFPFHFRFPLIPLAPTNPGLERISQPTLAWNKSTYKPRPGMIQPTNPGLEQISQPTLAWNKSTNKPRPGMIQPTNPGLEQISQPTLAWLLLVHRVSYNASGMDYWTGPFN